MTIADLVTILRNYFNDNGNIVRQEILYGLTDGINFEFYFNNYPLKKDSEKITVTDCKRKNIIPNTEYILNLDTGLLSFKVNPLITIEGSEILKSKFIYQRNNEEMVCEQTKDILVTVEGESGVGKFLIDGQEYVCGIIIEDVVFGYKISISDTIGCLDETITVSTKYSIPPRNSLVVADYQYINITDDKIEKYINNALVELNCNYKKAFSIVKPEPQIGAVVFTGTGVDDMTVSGFFTGSTATNYCVQIDSEGTPDTFKWSKDGGLTWEATLVEITGAEQPLSDGIMITFASTEGHTLNDRWDFSTIVYEREIRPEPTNSDKALIILQANILRIKDELQKAIDESIIYSSGSEKIDRSAKVVSLQVLLNNEQKRFMDILEGKNMNTDLYFKEFRV